MAEKLKRYITPETLFPPAKMEVFAALDRAKKLQRALMLRARLQPDGGEQFDLAKKAAFSFYKDLVDMDKVELAKEITADPTTVDIAGVMIAQYQAKQQV